MNHVAPVDAEIFTHCTNPECGQKLLIQRPGRDKCERCRMGRTQSAETATEETNTKAVVERPACRGCGRTEATGGGVSGLADGYCLLCRLDEKHKHAGA